MLLALDAGNTNITIGAFEGRELVGQWRLRTVHEQTADEWGILLRNLFSPAGLDIAQGRRHHHLERGAAHRSTLALHGAALLPHRSHVRHAAHRYRPRHPLRQSERSGRRPPGQRRRGFSQIRRPVRGRRSGHHHQLRRDLARRRVSGRRRSRWASASRSTRCSRKTARLPLVDFRAPEELIGTNTVGSMQIGPLLTARSA